MRYKPEPKGQEDWVSIPILYALGVGDCDDIGGARVAELRGGHRCKPERALPYLKQVPIGFHVQARRASGRIEDPSAILGMPT